MIREMGLKSEILTLVFGMLLIMLTFGDSHLSPSVGNLDTIFGQQIWPLLDVAYPLVSITVFLLYGRVNGGLRANALTIGMFFSYLFAITLMCLDDIAIVSHLSIMPSKEYWTVVQWFYPLYSTVAFFIFGKANRTKKLS